MACFTWKAGVKKPQATEPVPLPWKCGRRPAVSLPGNPLPAGSAEFSLSRLCSTDHIPIFGLLHEELWGLGDPPAHIRTPAPPLSTEWLSQ